MGYYEAARSRVRAQHWAGMIGTALVIAVAQLGGPTSPIFTLPIYLLFVAINIGIASVMLVLDRNREALMDELAAANLGLRTEQERSAALQTQLLAQAREAGITEERQRLSREIHDTVAQNLVAIIAQLEAATSAPDSPERDRRLALADSAAREALAEARRAVHALASPRLDDDDLPLALDDLLGEWRETTGLGGELTVAGEAAPSGHDDDLLRVAQEALSNVAKHARANRADVRLAYADGGVRLAVVDDGAGFVPSQASGGYGLLGMETRLGVIGGRLDVRSAPGEGTRVEAWVPLAAPAPQAPRGG